MKLEGKLKLHIKNNKICEYTMFNKGRLTNISEILDTMHLVVRLEHIVYILINM